jgi:hypothetical protein
VDLVLLSCALGPLLATRGAMRHARNGGPTENLGRTKLSLHSLTGRRGFPASPAQTVRNYTYWTLIQYLLRQRKCVLVPRLLHRTNRLAVQDSEIQSLALLTGLILCVYNGSTLSNTRNQAMTQIISRTPSDNGTEVVIAKITKGFAVSLRDTDADQTVGFVSIFHSIEEANAHAQTIIHGTESEIGVSI